jgi:acid phosphatase
LQPITSDNIFRELNRAQMSWKVYAESLPSPGFMGDYAGNYVKRHNPAAWYSDVINDWVQQQNMVPFTQFAQDLAAENLPNYAIVVPDLTHDAHDGTIQMADLWLQQNIAPLLESSHFRAGGNGLMFITFDNGDGDAQGQVFTAVIGPKVIPGAKVGAPFRHENTLRTVIEKFGLMVFPGASTSAEPMNQFFENPDESSRERRRPHRKAPIESS